MRPTVPRAAIQTLIHIHFEGFVDLVDRRWAEGLDLSRAVFAPCASPHQWIVEAPARRTRSSRTAPLPRIPSPGRLLLRVIPDGEGRPRTEELLLDAYLDLFLGGPTPDRILAVSPGSPATRARVDRRWIVDRLERRPGEPRLRLPYLAVDLGQRMEWEWFDRGKNPSACHHLTSTPGTGNLRPVHSPFRRDPPCNSVSSVYPSRERRRYSIR